ncbi:aspartyl-phosphate phosphatase Spo0E family protein [Texcoconibacillus texcoconensis]|uniref:Stage 0 sporulation regulatory protein n=1 Tax=Texcoconibacillus texcoconensis TaxID=1095777 RepID=A0A840QSR8_9BACI|nr:aspartyl-phosphate phosphatase Spo0E family protein [Texcoconibacillus texcoconensis]MBB5174317.1 stage 0 sporulation regulatory protein [Texcoconibacillus texcoconensis]
MEDKHYQMQLLEKIENTRLKMYRLALCSNTTREEVLNVSSELDKLLNQYQLYKNKENMY